MMNFNPQINRKTIVDSLAWKMLERLVSQGINLAVQIVLARLLLPEDFGSLAIIVAITNYAAIFVQSGLATAIVQKEDLDDLDISTLLTASLVLALLFYVLIFFLAPLISVFYKAPLLVWPLRILALILFLNALNSIQTALLSRKMQFKKLFIRSIIAVPFSGAIGIAMAYMGFGIWALVAHNLINMLAVVIIMSIGNNMPLHFRFSFSRAKVIYAFSGKILLSSMASGFHDAFRTMTIGKVYTSSALAYYDKAYTYSGYISLLVNSSISSVLLPAFSRSQSNLAELRQMARRSVKLSAFVMFPVLLGVAAIAKPLILLLITEKWAMSIPYLMIFCILRMPGSISSIDKQVFYAMGKSGINLIFEICLLIVNISALLITVRLNTMAIAIGATLVELAGGIAMVVVSSRVYQYRIRDKVCDLIRPLLNSMLMAILVWCIQLTNLPILLTLVIQITVGAVIYVLLAKLTRDDNLNYILNYLKNKRDEITLA